MPPSPSLVSQDTATWKCQTGAYPIGARLCPKSTHHQDAERFADWAAQTGFSSVDLARDADQDQAIQKIQEHNIQVRCVDLPLWKELLSENHDTRQQAIDRNAAYIQHCATFGIKRFFIVLLPENRALDHSKKHELACRSLTSLAAVLEEQQAQLGIEGWPGPGAICTTPQEYSDFFKDCPSPSIGINYDPSHLIRLGIDPLRFISEFGKRIVHVHAKDCAIDPTAQYRLSHAGACWRYCLPGHGAADWLAIMQGLVQQQYQGHVTIEHEDRRFISSDTAISQAFQAAAQFLSTI